MSGCFCYCFHFLCKTSFCSVQIWFMQDSMFYFKSYSWYRFSVSNTKIDSLSNVAMDLCSNAWLVFLFISTFHVLGTLTQKPSCKIKLRLKLENLAANTSCALGLQWNSKVYEPHCSRAPFNGIPFLTHANLQPLQVVSLVLIRVRDGKGLFSVVFLMGSKWIISLCIPWLILKSFETSYEILSFFSVALIKHPTNLFSTTL